MVNTGDVKMGYLSQVHQGDALAVAESLPKGCCDLVYIDPPFFTKREHVGRGRGEAALGHKFAFMDIWAGGVEGYLEWLEPRVRAMQGVLKPRGVFLLHLDWHAVHYAKVLCDAIFGMENFQNELIWYYQTGGACKSRFSRKHDTILMYAPDGHYFNGKAVAIPRGAGAMKRARSGRGARIAVTDTHKNPDDVLVVPALNAMAVERTGYPTQKPVALLEILLKALCPPGGTVADFFCGSGTTLVAAKRLGLSYIGSDVSAAAVTMARKRLAS